MTATTNDHELVNEVEKLALDDGANAAQELTVADEPSQSRSTHAPLPWIGGLRNPQVGPMMVLDDSGYLVPLCTAGDLLRGCRYFWRAAQD
jgi:hypothetical protein